MAEEKKETTKKTTPKKKEAVEEIKVEKRFCTKCGKELKEGEVCDCSTTEEVSTPSTVNGDAIVNTCKNVWNTIINVFKRPATTIKEEVESKENNKSIILLVLLAVSFAFYLMAIISGMVSGVEEAANSFWSYADAQVDVNYFQVFIYGILIYAIVAIIPIVAALIVGKITKNNNFTFKKAFKLYITSNAPLVLVYLGMAIILLIDVNLLNVLGTIASMIISVLCFFNFILGFNSEIKVKEDRRSYAITGLITTWIVILVVAFLIVGATIFGSIIEDVPSSSDNIFDLFS